MWQIVIIFEQLVWLWWMYTDLMRIDDCLRECLVNDLVTLNYLYMKRDGRQNVFVVAKSCDSLSCDNFECKQSIKLFYTFLWHIGIKSIMVFFYYPMWCLYSYKKMFGMLTSTFVAIRTAVWNYIWALKI